jgi:hypothetical protein
LTITAKIIADSVSEEGIRITSLQLRYPRFIHAELMTHRVFSRNASSSRAVPVERLIEDIIRDTAMPIHWGKNQKGMQADNELTGWRLWAIKKLWRVGMYAAVGVAKIANKIGGHKQIVNRFLEPFSHINVLVTATSFDNFYELRRHKDAQPEIHELADRMFEQMAFSKPTLLKTGEWHLPYIMQGEIFTDEKDIEKWKKCSVARCARVSYMTHEGKQPLVENDLKLYTLLVGARPLHASPAEHQATPDGLIHNDLTNNSEWEQPELHGNFIGWIQNRKILEKEHVW